MWLPPKMRVHWWRSSLELIFFGAPFGRVLALATLVPADVSEDAVVASGTLAKVVSLADLFPGRGVCGSVCGELDWKDVARLS